MVIAMLALLAGCDGAPKQTNDAVPAAVPDASNATDTGLSADQTATGGNDLPTPAASDDVATPAPGDLTIDDSAQGAANLIRHYYADIDRGDFRAAYRRWGDAGQDSRQSFADFKRGFAETATTSVDVGTPGDSEGAAGSIYIDVPVTVHARLKDGTAQTFTGHYTLRRVNDVPGSTEAQRRWHIYSAALKPE